MVSQLSPSGDAAETDRDAEVNSSHCINCFSDHWDERETMQSDAAQTLGLYDSDIDIPANQYPAVCIALRIAGNKYTLQATYCKIIIECNDALRGMYRGRYIWNSWLRARYCKVLVLQGIGDTELQALHRTGAGVAAQAWQAVTHREATAAFPAVFQCTEPLAMQCSHLFLQKILLSSVFEKAIVQGLLIPLPLYFICKSYSLLHCTR